MVDPNRLRAEPLADSQPILYAIDASSMQVLQMVFRSTEGELVQAGKYNTPLVANGMVFVGTSRISAYGLRQ
jgi:hypothetical protein